MGQGKHWDAPVGFRCVARVDHRQPISLKECMGTPVGLDYKGCGTTVSQHRDEPEKVKKVPDSLFGEDND
jgi:hypothetical protein